MRIMGVGIDLAKQVFQIHGVDERGRPVLKKRLQRSKVREFFAQLEPCVVGMEACGSAPFWARELSQLGHEVKLMAAPFVRPYRKKDKNDGNDAAAICEAVARPTMRFVAVKTPEQQAVLTLHRARELVVAERTALANQTRGLLGEFGLVVNQGIAQVRRALPAILEDAENGLPGVARETFAELYERLVDLDRRVQHSDRRLTALAQEMEPARRLMQVEGVGVLTATALIATVGDASMFNNGRQFAAWVGLVPRQFSTGGKPRLGRITKHGDVYLRTLLVHGARGVLRHLGEPSDAKGQWVQRVKAHRGYNNAAVALAAKNARILWALLARGARYQPATV